MYRKQEDNVKIAIADYLNLQYPGVPFMMQWDHLKLPTFINKKGQRICKVGAKFKRMRCNIHNFVWPDCFICNPTPWDICQGRGLFLEIKKNKDEVYTRKGEMRNSEQIQKEYSSLFLLRDMGYEANFTWSLDHAKPIIDYFLKRSP